MSGRKKWFHPFLPAAPGSALMARRNDEDLIPRLCSRRVAKVIVSNAVASKIDHPIHHPKLKALPMAPLAWPGSGQSWWKNLSNLRHPPGGGEGGAVMQV